MRARMLAGAVAALAMLTAPAASQAQDPVVFPRVTCVEYEPGDARATAHFGYTNTSPTPVTIFRGSDNLFVEPPQDRQQLELFEPGVHANVFSSTFDPAIGLRWYIKSQFAVARVDPALACPEELGLVASATVSGSAMAGAMLATDGGRYSGDSAPSQAYQWQRSTGGDGWEDVDGATAFVYWPVPGDVGRRLRVRVTATSSRGTVDATSTPTAAVVPADRTPPAPQPPPEPTAPRALDAPAVAGAPRVGNTLTASRGRWSGAPAPALAVQWQRCTAGGCRDVPGAVGTTYNPAAADARHAVRVRVTATNQAGRASAVSGQTAAVAAPARVARARRGAFVELAPARRGRRLVGRIRLTTAGVDRLTLRVAPPAGGWLRLRRGTRVGTQRVHGGARRMISTVRGSGPVTVRIRLARRAVRRPGAALVWITGTGAGGRDQLVVPVRPKR